MMRNDEMKVLE